MAENNNNGSVVEVGEVEILPAPTPRLRIPLRSAEDVRRELAKLYRQMKSGQIQPQDGTKLAYVLNLLRQAIETGELEARISALEAETNKLRGDYD